MKPAPDGNSGQGDGEQEKRGRFRCRQSKLEGIGGPTVKVRINRTLDPTRSYNPVEISQIGSEPIFGLLHTDVNRTALDS